MSMSIFLSYIIRQTTKYDSMKFQQYKVHKLFTHEMRKLLNLRLSDQRNVFHPLFIDKTLKKLFLQGDFSESKSNPMVNISA